MLAWTFDYCMSTVLSTAIAGAGCLRCGDEIRYVNSTNRTERKIMLAK